MYDYNILNNEDEEEIKKLFIGRKVKIIKNDNQKAILKLDNEIELEVKANEGCGGCNSGWYSIENINNVDNAITNVELVCDKLENYGGYSYKIFVFCEDTRINLLQVDGDDGNGYYGTGYEIIIKTNIIDLLNLYNKEKEKNVKLKKDIKILYRVIDEIKKERDKIKEKIKNLLY